MPTRRGHNEGSYYQIADGRWRAAVTVHHPDGRVTRKYLTARTQREVRARVKEWQAKQERAAPVPAAQAPLREYLARWLADQAGPSVRPRTLAAYALCIRRLDPYIGGVQLAALKAPAIQSAYAALIARGLAPKTVEQTHSVLHNALERAVDWEILQRNPSRAVTVPRATSSPRPTLTADQVGQLLAATTDTRWHALWAVLATLGLRLGEASGLRWSDIDLAGGTLTVRRQIGRVAGQGLVVSEPKSRAGLRTLPLPDVTRAALAAWRERQTVERTLSRDWRDEDLVFCTANGRRMDPKRVNEAWDVACRRAGLPRIRPHDLRHTAGSLLAKAGVPPRVAADILGHSTIVLTLGLYTHSTPEQLTDAAARMNSLVE